MERYRPRYAGKFICEDLVQLICEVGIMYKYKKNDGTFFLWFNSVSESVLAWLGDNF